MREMKDSGILGYGPIPHNWKISKVKYITKFKAGVAHEGSWDYDGNYIIVNSRFVSTEGDTQYKFSDKQLLPLVTDDICIVLSDLPNGRALARCLYITDNNKYTLNQRVGAFYSYNIFGRFFYYLMDRNVGLLKYDDGMNQTNLQYEDVYNCEVIIPPEQEQIRIACLLDKKCDDIKAIVSDIQSQIETLEEYKRSVITEAVTKGLDPDVEMRDSGVQWIGMMPTHWDCQRGKYILRYVQKPVRDDDGVITCFRDGEVTLRSNRREEGFTMADKEIGYQGIDVGDLVVHGMDGFAGSIGISDSRGKASPVLNVLDTEQNKRYIMYYLRSMAYNDVFVALATGIRVRSCDLRWNKLAELLYPMPPVEEQQAIVEHIDSVLERTNAIIADKKQQIETIEEYKKSLIFEYVTGKKEVVNE